MYVVILGENPHLEWVDKLVTIMPTMGEKIRDARLQRGLTQADLGGDVVSASMISQIEADKAKPSYPLLTAIANRLGVPPEHFMSDLDDQFALTAYIRLAEYFLIAHQPHRAVDILIKHASTTVPGRHRQEYLLLMAKAQRQLSEYTEAIHFIEDLREQAFRLQDHMLMFDVLKESGYIEYGMGNLDGAMFEWRRARDIGERICRDQAGARTQLDAELTDVYFAMYRLHLRLGQTKDADECLHRAAEQSASGGQFRDIARGYIESAFSALDFGDAGNAKVLIERAVHVLSAARLVELYILVHTKHTNGTDHASIDPWSQAAIATATADPSSFIEAELTRISQSIVSGDADEANRRIDRCLDILRDYRLESHGFGDWIFPCQHKLNICKARVTYLLGNHTEAVKMLEELMERLQTTGEEQTLLEVCAHLVMWYAEERNTEGVYKLSNEIERLTEQLQNRASQLG